jgi:HEAT repeat protein
MMKTVLAAFISLLFVAAFAGETAPAPLPLELKVVSHRTVYAVDRGGKSTKEYIDTLAKGTCPSAPYGPAVVLMIELRNTGDKEIIAYGAPRPKFVLKGPRAESVFEIAPTQFQVPPSRRYALGAGKSIFLNVISFCVPEKDEPSVKDTTKRLSYSQGCALQCVNWTEPGEYTLSAVLPLGVSPPPANATEFDSKKYAFQKLPENIGQTELVSNAVKLTIREGSETDYWSEALSDPDAAAIPLAEPTRLNMALAVKDSDPRVRKSAARALQRPASMKVAGNDYSNDPAVQGLLGALKDANAGVRAFAVTALATWGDSVKPSAPAAMLPLLQDPDAAVRLATADALSEMFTRGAPPEHAVGVALTGALKDADERVINSTLVALGRVKNPDAVAMIIPFCKHPNSGIANAAIQSLGNIGPAAKQAEDALFAAIMVNDTRSAAATALAGIKADGTKLLPALITAMKAEEDEFGRVAIARAMGTCGEPAVPVLLDVLNKDKDSTVRQYAAETLASLGHPVK